MCVGVISVCGVGCVGFVAGFGFRLRLVAFSWWFMYIFLSSWCDSLGRLLGGCFYVLVVG